MSQLPRVSLELLFCLLLPIAASGQTLGSWGDQGDGTFRNPILNADYPDVDIERDGDKFFMITSTIHTVPGMTILESRDLVNWTILEHVFEKLDWDPKFNWDRMSGYGSGVWAGDLAKHDGRWYCYFIHGGLYVSTAEKITGPWSAPVCVRQDGVGTDPTVFWDHEQKQGWLICKAGNDTSSPDPAMRLVKLFKLSWDGLRLDDEGQVIYRGRGSEAAKIYRIDGQFYVFLVDNDARDDDRKQVVLRGPRLDGPLERKVVLERGNGATRSCSQGALVQVRDGSWWLTHQLKQMPWQRQDGILWNESYEGRPQCLVPVTWKDGWPVVGKDPDDNGIGNTVQGARKPVPGIPLTAPQTDDNFDSSKLGLQWQWNHNPRDTHWSLTERPGWLRLKAGKPVAGGQRQGPFWNAANTLSQRLMGTGQGMATIRVDLRGMQPGQHAGICHFGGQYVLLGVKVNKAGHHQLFFNRDGQETLGPEVSGKPIYFRTQMQGNRATFSFSLDDRKWERLGSEFMLRMGHWRGDRIGFFCWNDDTDEPEKSGHFDVDWFHYCYDGPKGLTPVNQGTQP